MEWIIQNKHWIFSGVGVALVAALISVIKWVVKNKNIELNDLRKENSELRVKKENSIYLSEEVAGKVFVTAPMASVNKADYTSIRGLVVNAVSILKELKGVKEVYCPLLDIGTYQDFESVEVSIIKEFRQMKESSHFVFICPKRLTSSLLIEMGYAIALNKKTYIYCRSRASLPYMLRQADRAMKHIEIQECKDEESILERLEGLVINNDF